MDEESRQEARPAQQSRHCRAAETARGVETEDAVHERRKYPLILQRLVVGKKSTQESGSESDESNEYEEENGCVAVRDHLAA